MPKVRLIGLLGCIFFASFVTLREISSAEPASGDAQPANLWSRTTGSDWEHFLGPTRDNKSAEKGLLTNWPKAGPRIVWKKPLGEGYGGPTISRGRLFQFDRFGDQARIYALHAESGKELCKKVEKHRVETDQTITQMLSKDETMGLVNVLKKMLEKEEN